MPNAFTTVAVFRDPVSAEFYQNVLTEDGIQAFLPEINSAFIWPMLTWSQARIRLQVPTEDAERARTLLQEAARRCADSDKTQLVPSDQGPLMPDFPPATTGYTRFLQTYFVWALAIALLFIVVLLFVGL